MAITDKFSYVGEPGSATYLASPGYTMAGTSINLQTYVGWPTGKVIFDMYTTELVGQTEQEKAGTRTSWQGIHNGSGVISSLQRLGGNDQNYPAASSSKVVITHSAYHTNQMVDGIANQHNLTDGSHKGITTDTLTASGAVTAASFIVAGSQTAAGWLPVGATISGNPTYNGNRSYDLTFSADMSGIVSPGMRLRTTRTVAAPTQSTSLNGTNQYYSKSSPAGMTGTNNYVSGGWFKITSYGFAGLVSKWTSAGGGWRLVLNASGQVQMDGFNGGSTNSKTVISYQSVPLNKWFHVAAQLDMTNTTNDATNNYIMIDGVNVPATVVGGGTSPTAWTNSGVLEIGSQNGGSTPLPGKAAQVFVFGAKVTQATMRGYISQGLSGTETSLISAYSFNGVATDLNTTNANNLTANGSAVATNADSPFGGQAGGTISSTLDYGIVQEVTASTITVQVPEGCTLPTTGGISAVSYATSGNPFGWVSDKDRWEVATVFVGTMNSTMANGVWTRPQDVSLSGLTGLYTVGYSLAARGGSSATSYINLNFTLSTSASAEADASLTSRFGGDQSSVGTMAHTASGSKQKTMVLTPGTVLYPIMSQVIAGTSLSNCGWYIASINKIYAIPAGI